LTKNEQHQLATRIHNLLSIVSGVGGSANTNNLKKASTELNSIYKQNKSSALICLLEISLTSPQDAIRQLAAVESRKRVENTKSKPWESISPPTRTIYKVRFFQLFKVLNLESTSGEVVEPIGKP